MTTRQDQVKTFAAASDREPRRATSNTDSTRRSQVLGDSPGMGGDQRGGRGENKSWFRQGRRADLPGCSIQRAALHERILLASEARGYGFLSEAAFPHPASLYRSSSGNCFLPTLNKTTMEEGFVAIP